MSVFSKKDRWCPMRLYTEVATSRCFTFQVCRFRLIAVPSLLPCSWPQDCTRYANGWWKPRSTSMLKRLFHFVQNKIQRPKSKISSCGRGHSVGGVQLFWTGTPHRTNTLRHLILTLAWDIKVNTGRWRPIAATRIHVVLKSDVVEMITMHCDQMRHIVLARIWRNVHF